MIEFWAQARIGAAREFGRRHYRAFMWAAILRRFGPRLGLLISVPALALVLVHLHAYLYVAVVVVGAGIGGVLAVAWSRWGRRARFYFLTLGHVGRVVRHRPYR